MSSILRYTENNLAAFLHWNDGCNSLNPVALLTIASEEDGECYEAYAKPISTDTKNKDGINEVAAWLIGKSLGLPVAEHAGIINIPSAEVPPYFPATPPSNPDTLSPYRREDGTINFFFTSAIVDEHIPITKITAPKFAKQLAEWGAIDDCIAYDCLISNTDRHLNNILRDGDGKFHLIDHGLCFGSHIAKNNQTKHWTPQTALAATPSTDRTPNKLHLVLRAAHKGLNKNICWTHYERACLFLHNQLSFQLSGTLRSIKNIADEESKVDNANLLRYVIKRYKHKEALLSSVYGCCVIEYPKLLP